MASLVLVILIFTLAIILECPVVLSGNFLFLMTLYQFLDVNPAGSAAFESSFELDSLAAVASPASQSATDESGCYVRN